MPNTRLRSRRMSARQLNPRKELLKLIRHIPDEKINSIIKIIRTFDTETITAADMAAIRAGKAAIDKGDTISLDEFCRHEGI